MSFCMEKLKITTSGQVSLPARIRRRWGTTSVTIEDRGSSVVLRPVPDDPVAAAAGFLKGRIPPTEELRSDAREDERAALERRERR
jgi:bifunctional DNA-binding transcriptional regulator/antitoxin component of YhaV-PrlF toxin-antitoxin module